MQFGRRSNQEVFIAEALDGRAHLAADFARLATLLFPMDGWRAEKRAEVDPPKSAEIIRQTFS
jgi:hypothetical protein